MQTLAVIQVLEENPVATTAGLAPLLVLLGTFIKNHTPIDNNWIPLILLVVGTVFFVIATRPITVDSVILGIGASIAAVGLHAGTRSTAALKKKEES